MDVKRSNRICALIPARYQSNRLPGKPLLKINNKTIIQRTYEQTTKSKLLDKIIVVTDDDRIVKHIQEFGGDVVKVDIPCLNGTERICHVLNKLDHKYDIIVNVQGDEPFINPDNIDFAINKYLENELDERVMCTTIHSLLTDIEDLRNRGIGKMILDKYNNVLYCSRALIPHTKSGDSDKNTRYYGHIGIFVFRRNYLPEFLSHPNTPAQLAEDIEWLKILEMGYSIKSFQVKSTEIGINTTEDFNYLSKKYGSK